MFNIQKMMQQAQQVQFKMQELQEKLKDIEVDGESGGGLVKVKMTCSGNVVSVDIDPSILKPEDAEMIGDLVTAALNNAGDARDARMKSETEGLMSEMGLPADMKFPF